MAEEPMEEPEVIAAFLKVPEGTLTRWRYMNTGPSFFKVGRHVRYRMSDVEKWLEDQKAGSK